MQSFLQLQPKGRHRNAEHVEAADRKPRRARRVVAVLASAVTLTGIMFGAATSASASGIGDPYNPPSATDGNDWYNGQEAASYALATVNQPQPFDEACAWFVSNALWAGGLPEDDVWNENTSHGNMWSFAAGQGSPIAADVTMLTQYLLTNYPASYLQQLDLSPNATSWPASLGDVIIYVWGGDPNWLTDGDHNIHMALVTHIEPSGYPDVSEWGDVGEDAVSPDNPWRG